MISCIEVALCQHAVILVYESDTFTATSSMISRGGGGGTMGFLLVAKGAVVVYVLTWLCIQYTVQVFIQGFS